MGPGGTVLGLPVGTTEGRVRDRRATRVEDF